MKPKTLQVWQHTGDADDADGWGRARSLSMPESCYISKQPFALLISPLNRLHLCSPLVLVRALSHIPLFSQICFIYRNVSECANFIGMWLCTFKTTSPCPWEKKKKNPSLSSFLSKRISLNHRLALSRIPRTWKDSTPSWRWSHDAVTQWKSPKG